MEIVKQYFPELTPEQEALLTRLGPLFREWNQKINLVSRKDIDNLYTHHVLHSLALARIIRFNPGAEILDRRKRNPVSRLIQEHAFDEVRVLQISDCPADRPHRPGTAYHTG